MQYYFSLKNVINMNESKLSFFHAICNKEDSFITKMLKDFDCGAFEMQVSPGGFALIDDAGSAKMTCNHDDFYLFLTTTNFLDCTEEYDYFITTQKDDNELHNQLELFYYTELHRATFRNSIVYGCYQSCFTTTEIKLPVEVSAPPYDLSTLSTKDNLYFTHEELQETC